MEKKKCKSKTAELKERPLELKLTVNEDVKIKY